MIILKKRFVATKVEIIKKYEQSSKLNTIKFANRHFILKKRFGLFSSLLKNFIGLNQFRSIILSTNFGLNSNINILKLRNLIPFQFVRIKTENHLKNTFLNDFHLYRFIRTRIKEKAIIGTLYNLRILRSLPIRGQRTKTNSKTARSYFKKLNLFKTLN